MNKAFVREPDAAEARCPKCGTPGTAVPEQTLNAMIPPERLSDVAKTAYFCDFPRCDVAYFDDFERFVEASALKGPVWPKDSDAPLCSCFGLTADDVRSDVAEGGVRRVRAIVERSKSSEARCAECSPTGRSCVAAVQRYYFQLKGGGAS
ncbi:MAG: hypothetical protein C0483_14245 [Pirellula sp.]|nr:hypothetical protein [Pirellula sp.]